MVILRFERCNNQKSYVIKLRKSLNEILKNFSIYVFKIEFIYQILDFKNNYLCQTLKQLKRS